jgi:HK97 family phage major capsid protein
MSALSNTKLRLERLVDERTHVEEKVEDILEAAEEEKRDLGDFENEQLAKHRTRVQELENEINLLAFDLERAKSSKDVSALLRDEPIAETGEAGGPVVYRSFAAYARDELIVRYPLLATSAGGDPAREAAADRLQRAVVNTTTTQVPGLLPPTHMAQIMDIINGSRPVVASAKQVNLDRGKLTYPQIAQRPEVLKQSSEKTVAGTANMQVTLQTLTADTYLGGGDLSWQTINWSTPDALQLWFDLAAEAYARATETAACTELGTAAAGTVSPVLGTAGTEDFGAWRDAVIKAIGTIYSSNGGRARTDTLYVSATRFFQLAALGTSDVVQLSAIGNVDIGGMTGTFSGLRVIGSYGFTGNTAIVGDSNAFLVGETGGAPVELRAVEPSIGGMEVGVIGAFKAKVYDTTRFLKLNA